MSDILGVVWRGAPWPVAGQAIPNSSGRKSWDHVSRAYRIRSTGGRSCERSQLSTSRCVRGYQLEGMASRGGGWSRRWKFGPADARAELDHPGLRLALRNRGEVCNESAVMRPTDTPSSCRCSNVHEIRQMTRRCVADLVCAPALCNIDSIVGTSKDAVRRGSVTIASYPELVAQWHPERNGDLRASDVSRGSKKKIWWVCGTESDHVWSATAKDRTGRGSGCPACAGLQVSITNSIATTYPSIVDRWHPERNGVLTPTDVVARTEVRYWWKCNRGPDHEWESTPTAVANLRDKCPFCSGRAVCPVIRSQRRIPLWRPNGTRRATRSKRLKSGLARNVRFGGSVTRTRSTSGRPTSWTGH